MDPIANPFNPGAGTPPPELAGRDDLREKVRIGTERLRIGNAAKSLTGKGMVWSPAHGDTAFNVPLFHEYLLRALRA